MSLSPGHLATERPIKSMKLKKNKNLKIKTYNLFKQAQKYSTKLEKYFDVYDSVFEKFRKKKLYL